MAAPTPYDPATDFSAYGAANPSTPHAGASLDAEFAAIQTSLDETQANLAVIQRADNLIANSVVHPDAFTTASLALMGGSWAPKGAWATATEYLVGDVVSQSGISYVCTVLHTSGTFSTDLANANWIKISSDEAISISFTPAGAIAATDVQNALEELDSEKQALDATLTALAGVATGADVVPYFTAADVAAAMTVTAAARTVLDDATTDAMLATLAASGTALANVFTKTQTWNDGGDIASAASLTLGDGNVFNITGTTAITSIGTKGIGTIVFMRFASALDLTHNATDLVCLTGANITTAAGDWAIWEEYAAGDWRMIGYMRYSGKALVETASLTRGTALTTTSGATAAFSSIAAGANRITVMLAGVSGSGTDNMQLQLGDAGGLETGSYLSTSTDGAGTDADFTSGFGISTGAATVTLSGNIVLTRIDGNKWTCSYTLIDETEQVITGAGQKELSAELTQLALLFTGSDTFDAGTVNILVE